MVLICASDVLDRVHGFLRSVMLNPHPGVYVAVDLDAGSRRRVWEVLAGWWGAEPRGMLLMLWTDKSKPMGLAMEQLGVAKREIIDYDGHWAVRSSAVDKRKSSFETSSGNSDLAAPLPPRERG